jgi:hypothetical protein
MDAARRRRRRRWLVVGLALLAGPLFAEGVLRWLLFSDFELARSLGARYRAPSLYVHDSNAPEFKRIEYLLAPPESRWLARNPHPVFGWLADDVDPRTLRHADEARLEDRRPVLLYGTSFARCYALTDCFEELLESSAEGERLAMLNYATGGYGLDQVLLLIERTIDLHAPRQPIVVLAFVVESDLDRCMMPFFTGPKPYYRRAADGFELVPPDVLDPAQFVRRHPPAASWFARYLVHGLRLLPEPTRRSLSGMDERIAERRLLWRHLLGRAQQTLQERGLEHFVLLFHAQGAAQRAWRHQDEPELLAFLEDSALPYVDSGVEVRAALDGGAREDELFLLSGRGGRPAPHPPRGGALLRGLEGRFDSAQPLQR